MHPAIIIGTVRSLIVDVAMGQIPRSTERISSFLYHFNREEILHATIIKFITSPDLCAHLPVWCELNQSVVNHAVDEWRRRLSACVDAEGGHYEHYL